MDFGSYFRSLLNEKKVSIAELADKLNIKSKNEIYRLLQNKYSYGIIKTNGESRIKSRV